MWRPGGALERLCRLFWIWWIKISKTYKTGWWQLKYFLNVHPYIRGRWTHFDEHIFQMGWFKKPPTGKLTRPPKKWTSDSSRHMKKIIDPYIKALGLKNRRISFWLRTGIQLPTSISWMHLEKLRWVVRSVFCFKQMLGMYELRYVFVSFWWILTKIFFFGPQKSPLFFNRFIHLSLGSGPMIPLGRRSSMLMEIRNPKQPPTTGWDLIKPW